MILAAFLLPVAIGVLLLCVQRFRLPAFLALMAVVVGYGIAADMTIQSIGKAFGLGFASALEQAGLLVIAGSLLRLLLVKEPLPSPIAAAAGVLAGLGGSATGGLALLQAAGSGAARRTVGLVLTLLVVHALITPAPLAVAAASVLRASTAAFSSIRPCIRAMRPKSSSASRQRISGCSRRVPIPVHGASSST